MGGNHFGDCRMPFDIEKLDTVEISTYFHYRLLDLNFCFDDISLMLFTIQILIGSTNIKVGT